MANQTNSMAHTKWMCKYHIVFTPKYRRKVIYNQYKEDIRDIIKALCKYKGVEIIEGHLMPDHIHMLVSIPPKYSISQFMGYLKGKSALMIYDKHANVTVHALRKQQRILPMLRIPNRQNLLPPLYHTAFSVQKMPTRVQ